MMHPPGPQITLVTPHLDKLTAALANPIVAADTVILKDAINLYHQWITGMNALTSQSKMRVQEMVALLNHYKDQVEVELIMKRGSTAIRRQKGQLKIDNSIIEEFLIHLVRPEIIEGLGTTYFVTGPQDRAFMGLSFMPRSFSSLNQQPEPVIKVKAQDFVLGGKVHYKFSSASEFTGDTTKSGSFVLAVLAAECKVNLDKTMFQEGAGTAARLKQGCPVAKYFLVAEYLDMQPEDPRLTQIDNVFLLRRAKRLPPSKRHKVPHVEAQRRTNPIDSAVVWSFVQEMQELISTALYDPDSVWTRGSFI